MMKLSNSNGLFILLLLIFPQEMRCQSQDEIFSETLNRSFKIGDLDFDKITDTVYYDSKEKFIIFSLSSQSYNPINVPTNISIDDKSISVSYFLLDGNFHIGYGEMRFYQLYTYLYSNTLKDFRNTRYYNQNLGSANNDGSGSFNLNMVTGEFEGHWELYDYELETLIDFVVKDTIPIPLSVYLLKDSLNYNEINSDSIYSSYVDKYYIDYNIGKLDFQKLVNDINLKCIIDTDISETNEYLIDKYSIEIENYLSDISFEKDDKLNGYLIKLYTKKNNSRYMLISRLEVCNDFVIIDIDNVTLDTNITYYFDYTKQIFNIRNMIKK